jgi:hypothetical protein
MTASSGAISAMHATLPCTSASRPPLHVGSVSLAGLRQHFP